MNEEVLNLQLRKFLKRVGITSQREIERAVREAVARGAIPGLGPLEAHVTLEMPAVGLKHRIDGTIALTD